MIAQLQDVRSLLHGAGLRYTRTRERVLKTLAESKRPLASDEIHRLLKGAVNMVTVYRVLESLVKKGLVYQTDFRSGKAFFEFQEDHHHHIVCTECGYREHVDVCVPHTAQPKGFAAVHNHMLEFFGVCKSCEPKRS